MEEGPTGDREVSVGLKMSQTLADGKIIAKRGSEWTMPGETLDMEAVSRGRFQVGSWGWDLKQGENGISAPGLRTHEEVA